MGRHAVPAPVELSWRGTDCLGLLRGVWREVLGPEPEAVPSYTPDWSEPGHREDLLAAAGRHLVAVPPETAQPGDVLILRMKEGGVAKHVGFLARSPLGHATLVHAYSGHGVVEVRADAGVGAKGRRRVSFSRGEALMATLLLAAAGSALGGSLGGSIAGLSAMALGKAAGAVVGSAIDQRLLGLGSEPVETGRVERFRVMGSSEGAPLARVFGRNRVAGQLIWSSRFLELVHSEKVGGKGGGASVREYSYSVSLAIALCEGEVSRIGRIWADGQPLDQFGLTFRLHPGSEDQLPDPLIEAIEGAAPAYRGTAYVVFENLDLTPFGNRIPQFNFEVFRRPKAVAGLPRPPALDVQGVALVPGTGEYALATEPVYFKRGKGDTVALNVHNDRGVPDLIASLDQLAAELPRAKSVALVVSWFGDDLRCGRCTLRPAVEQGEQDGTMRWVVSGQNRAEARVVSRLDGRPVFGGTPADASVLQAIARMKADGQSVMFYPFILMDIQAGNGLRDPWTGADDQPAVPWRGRITLDRAPGRAGSSDKSAAAADEVAVFFGRAALGDFRIDDGKVVYDGPEEWSYRRFALHYAHLCALSGGVDAFCIGSELRGLTQIRSSADSYPVVEALCSLAADIRAVLGPGVKIGYAADWSEYFGHQPADGSGDVLFNLDPLWASPAIDFVGIDNYMPLSDWREATSHADAGYGSIYNLDYLRGNVAGGEGYDWYYADQGGRAVQDRLPITDGAYGEDWIFRYKDLVSWWSKPHVNRVGGVKVSGSTAWQPRSKPIWFTELGCPAVDKGTNQPNVFHDPKSSESFFPYFSDGSRDDLIQYRYLQAVFAHWGDAANNPRSDVYGGPMVDMSRAHVWAWDARPWPDFPVRVETWVDGSNYELGHWLNGRTSMASLAEVVAEICDRSGLASVDVEGLYGGVAGYLVEAVESGRQSLQPLMVAYGFDSSAVGESLGFASRGGAVVGEIASDSCVVRGGEPVFELTRSPVAETADRVTMGFLRADVDYQPGAATAVAPEAAESAIVSDVRSDRVFGRRGQGDCGEGAQRRASRARQSGVRPSAIEVGCHARGPCCLRGTGGEWAVPDRQDRGGGSSLSQRGPDRAGGVSGALSPDRCQAPEGHCGPDAHRCGIPRSAFADGQRGSGFAVCCGVEVTVGRTGRSFLIERG